MRRLTTKSMIGGALIALLGTALSATAAQASPSSPRPCTAADFVTGACLTAVVTDPTTPAEMAAVRQAVASGRRSQAERFVHERGIVHHDKLQSRLEGTLHDSASAEPASPVAAAAGVGTVSGYVQEIRDTPTYLYCGASSCTQVGKLFVRWTTNITFYPTVTLDGEVDVTQGPSVILSNVECRTRDDINNAPDVTVKTWSNCSAIEGGAPISYRTIYPQNWTQGGGKGEKYFNQYNVTFRPNITGAPSFSFSWQTQRYYIPSSGHPYWLS